jgi:thiopeptide-type bacteriocin biosynthesis protein
MTMDNSPDEPAGAVERAVLAMLTGTPSHLAARHARLTVPGLTGAARAYQQAGRAALAALGAPSRTWNQVLVEFTDWENAERTAAAVLAPRLEDTEVICGWWFLRKHPHWRIRYQPATGAAAGQASEHVGAILGKLAAAGLVREWRHGIYEPEMLAFGGPEGISIAHQLFCTDSAGVLATFGQDKPTTDTHRTAGRKELSILLCAALMRAARLDWFEQGDTWHRLTALRPAPGGTATRHHQDAIRTLLTASTSPAGLILAPGGPVAPTAAWIAGFGHAGQALATAARGNQLRRGLRDILAHLIIFHWNRLGLTATTQAILARAAQDVIMNTGSR